MRQLLQTILIISSLCPFDASAQTNRQVVEIDSIRNRINSELANFRKIEVKKDSILSEYFYVKGKQLVLATVDFNDHGINKHVEWWFSERQEIFTKQNWTNMKGKVIDKEKMYLLKGHLLSWIMEDDIPVDTTSTEFHNTETALNTYSKKLIAHSDSLTKR